MEMTQGVELRYVDGAAPLWWRRSGLFEGLPQETLQEIGAGLERVHLRLGETLFRQHDVADSMYLVASGSLNVVVRGADGLETVIDAIRAGEPAGETQLLTRGKRTASLIAREDTVVIRFPAPVYDAVSDRDADVSIRMAALVNTRLRIYRLRAILPRILGPMDSAACDEISAMGEWVHLSPGGVLCRQGESDCTLSIVVSGRLRAMVTGDDGRHRSIGEIEPGETVGEMALFTGDCRTATVYAVRDTNVIRFTSDVFGSITGRYPHVVMAISRIVIRRLQRRIAPGPTASRTGNIALLSVSDSLKTGEVAGVLTAVISEFASVLHLNSERLDESLETPFISQSAEESAQSIRVQAWLDEQESRHDFVIYSLDEGLTEWSSRCLRQADHVVLVADATGDPRPEVFDRLRTVGGPGLSVRTSLVLLHPSDAPLPTGTRRWLEGRSFDRCYHVRCGRDDDFRRLGRILAGRGVGLVMSGGGAKGYAHIGVLKALEERGIAVDMVGGSSMGALVAAAHAMGYDADGIRELFKDLVSTYRPFTEYAVPFVSVLRGRRMERMLRRQVADLLIEDLWLNFFCVSSSLVNADAVVSDRGPLYEALRSGIALPGIISPVVSGNDLLVDGGVLNNLPVDVMRSSYAGIVIGSDVAPVKDLEFDPSMKEFPTLWSVLRQRLNPRNEPPKVPNILQILFRTSVLSAIHHQCATQADADVILRPPTDAYGIMQFEAIDEIVDAGYRYAIEAIKEWPADLAVAALGDASAMPGCPLSG